MPSTAEDKTFLYKYDCAELHLCADSGAQENSISQIFRIPFVYTNFI